jgi:TolB-like protein/DNA-binding SARP family transcriptional activator/Flp pilus assembly protein TadD
MTESRLPFPRIHVTALGTLRIEREGEVVVGLPGQPVRCALLVYLAVERGATRDELAALLWPERSSGRARRLLSQTLYELRRQLGDGWLETRWERVEATAALTADAVDFLAATDAREDEAALRIYGGAFLDGCHLGGTPAFEQWVDRRRAEIARRFRDASRRLTARLIESGDAEGGLAVARRWAEVDPLEDEAHHYVIELLAEMGRRSEAMRHFEAYRELIARELEVEPLEETVALVARIQENAPRPEPDPRPSVPPRTDAAGDTQPIGVGRGFRRFVASSRNRGWLAGLGVAAILVGLILGWSGARVIPLIGSGPREALLDPHGVAVLPFLNLSGDPEQEYFSDGITEDLLAYLARFEDLTVISRTSVMQYKGTDRSLRQIGEELGVAHVLEGSVRRVDDRVRIVAQLIDARSDRHLWAESYDRELTDIFAIQSEIAQRIAGALRDRLTPEDRERMETAPTASLTAYDFYLQGREYYYRYRDDDHWRAIELFRRAIEVDSTFSLAWAGLALAYAVLPGRQGAPREWADSGVVAAQRAIALDPGLAEAYHALGLAYQIRGRYRHAEEAFDRALTLSPNHAPALASSGSNRYATGRWDEALGFYHRSMAVDPITRIPTLSNMAIAYGALGLFTRARETNERLLALEPSNRPGLSSGVLLSVFLDDDPAVAVRKAEELLALEPDNPRAWITAATAWLFSGEYVEARRLVERTYDVAPEWTQWGRYVAVQLGFTLWKTGEVERARRVFAEFERFALAEIEAGNEDRELRLSLAALHAIQGNEVEAYRWLDEAVAAGWTDFLLLSRDPLFERLREDVRFQRIVAANRAEIERQRARVEREGW